MDEHISVQEHIDVIFEGLAIQYESLVALIHSKSKLRSLLLAHEHQIEKSSDL